MINWTIEVDGVKELDFAFKRVQDEIKDFRKSWPQVAEVFYGIERDQFLSQGARGGEPWARHAASTTRSRQGEWDEPSERILMRTGRLYGSLTRRDHPDAVYIEEPFALTLGSSVPYAIFHQRGTSKMPARKPIKLKPEDVGKLKRAFSAPVREAVKRAGFDMEPLEQLIGVEPEERDLSEFDFVDNW